MSFILSQTSLLKNSNFRYISLGFILLILLTSPVALADAGPKQQMTLTIENVEGKTAIVGLLLDNRLTSRWHLWHDPIGLNLPLIDTDNFSDRSIIMAHEYMGDDLTEDMVFDIEEGDIKIHYSYNSPSNFRIMVVQEDGQYFISDEINRVAFDSQITYDLESGIAKEKSLFELNLSMFTKTFFTTLVIEGVILFLFGFWTFSNVRTLIIVNLITQFLLTSCIATAMYALGILLAVVVIVFAEPLIFLFETYAFSRFLKGDSKAKKIKFALVANSASLVLGSIGLVIFS